MLRASLPFPAAAVSPGEPSSLFLRVSREREDAAAFPSPPSGLSPLATYHRPEAAETSERSGVWNDENDHFFKRSLTRRLGAFCLFIVASLLETSDRGRCFQPGSSSGLKPAPSAASAPLPPPPSPLSSLLSFLFCSFRSKTLTFSPPLTSPTALFLRAASHSTTSVAVAIPPAGSGQTPGSPSLRIRQRKSRHVPAQPVRIVAA